MSSFDALLKTAKIKLTALLSNSKASIHFYETCLIACLVALWPERWNVPCTRPHDSLCVCVCVPVPSRAQVRVWVCASCPCLWPCGPVRGLCSTGHPCQNLARRLWIGFEPSFSGMNSGIQHGYSVRLAPSGPGGLRNKLRYRLRPKSLNEH